MKDIKTQFRDLYEEGRLIFDAALAPKTSFKIGGPADVLAIPKTQTELITLLRYAIQNDMRWFILGAGSNLLIPDKGIRALVISMEAFTKITKDENFISAYAGVKLSALSEYAQQEGLAGLEFAHGIPGSVGGAVFMNAGAYGGEIKDVLYCSKCLSPELERLNSLSPILHVKTAEHEFAYRSSALQKKNMIHLSSVFRLSHDDPEAIKARMEEYDRQRNEKQPMALPSAGSVFKRPEGHYTGKLIDDCGLRGYRIGDAAISDKHCGFIVNLGEATAKDVKDLIKLVQDTVFTKYGIRLEPELRIIPEE